MSRKLIIPGLFLALAIYSVARADDTKPAVKPPDDSLQPLFSEIRFAAENDRWKQPDWSIAEIESRIEKLVAACRAATEDESLQVPVKHADIAAAPAPGLAPPGMGQLVIGRDVQVAHAHQCIILADGNAEIAHAHNSIIIARRVVRVSHARKCVIIGGSMVEVSHDGGRENEGSLIVCPGPIDIGFARGSSLCSLEEPRVSHVGKAYFIATAGANARATDFHIVKSAAISLASPADHAIRQKIEVVGFVRPQGIVFKYEGRRYFALPGQPITDEADQPVPALEGWIFSQLNDRSAVLTKDDAAVILRPPGGE